MAAFLDSHMTWGERQERCPHRVTIQGRIRDFDGMREWIEEESRPGHYIVSMDNLTTDRSMKHYFNFSDPDTAVEFRIRFAGAANG